MPGAAGQILLTLQTDVTASDAAAADVAPGFAVLRVADNGAGMTREVRQRLFEPFFTTKGSVGGTGLGLSVVHGIIAAQGGSIDVRSEPGEGTEFELRLPLASDATAEAPHPTSANPLASLPWDRLRHVLFVDDDEVVSLMVGALLERNGFACRCVSDPREALRLASNPMEPIDLMITDFEMPTMTGIELAIQVRQLRPTLLIVVSSGTIHAELYQLARHAGVWQVVHKDELVGALSNRPRDS